MTRFVKAAAALCLLFMFSSQAQAAMIEFNGALDLTYSDWGNDGPNSGIKMFDPYEFYLLGSVDIAQDVKGYFETRYEHANSLVELRQGYMEYQLYQAVAVRMGYFYMPVGQYWKSYYASTRKLASYSMPMRIINLTPWADSGVMLKGEIPVSKMNLNYMVAYTNGLDQDYVTAGVKPRNARQAIDNNNDKTVGARIGFACPQTGIEIGFSGATGKYDNAGTKNVTFNDVDFLFQKNDLELKGEWVQSKADDLLTTKDIVSKGYYAHVAYKVLKDVMGINYIEPAVRYEEVNAGRSITDQITIDPAVTGVVTRTCLGLNISPKPHFLLKFEYGMTKEEKTSKDNDSFFAQACIDF